MKLFIASHYNIYFYNVLYIKYMYMILIYKFLFGVLLLFFIHIDSLKCYPLI